MSTTDAEQADAFPCDRCGKVMHIDLLDGAPATPQSSDFDRLYCQPCYDQDGGVPWDMEHDGTITLLTWSEP